MRKLDKRIQNVTDIKTPFSEDFEELSNYIGFNAYGADTVDSFYDLTNCYSGTLKRVDDDDLGFPFIISISKEVYSFRYMILEKDLEPQAKKEKKYRPLTIDEFLNQFDIGEVIVFRSKVMPNIVCHVLFDGYTETDKETFVILGLHHYSLKELFSNYEYDNGDNWFNFGVEE